MRGTHSFKKRGERQTGFPANKQQGAIGNRQDRNLAGRQAEKILRNAVPSLAVSRASTNDGNELQVQWNEWMCQGRRVKEMADRQL